MNKIRLTKEERTALFLEWLDGTLEERGWRAEQVATKGDFDSSVITAYRKGKSAVGPKVAERAARAFGYDDEQTLKLLQRLQLVPGGSDDTEDGKAQQRGKHFAALIAEIDDDAEQERITGLVDAIIRQAVEQHRASRKAPRASRTSRSARP